jgi:adenine-specific DNA-methyltransferase
MHFKLISLKQSLNKAYLKEKVNRLDIELFKTNFNSLLEKINHVGDEEHLKSLIADFLKFTWYKDSFQINPIGKNDLVIHTGKSTADPLGVIIEVKSLVNKNEMISENKPNSKAFHELVLYYLHERIVNNRHDIKQLIATNTYDWFVFDANEFDKKIYRHSGIKKLYEQKRSDHKDNPWFYDELKKLLEQPSFAFDVTYFDLPSFQKWSKATGLENDKYLIPIFKILSPAHLLKIPFANDSNSLQPKFYGELLHIIGLHEYKEGSKKLIGRKKEGERDAGSLIENAIVNLDSHDKITRLEKPSTYGDNYQERLYNVALELVITWMNRILFLKLLEAQLLNYHKNEPAYNFLNSKSIRDFDDLDKLFFRVLAKRVEERSAEVSKLFSKVPYLNSSLFEPTELEHQTLFISALEDFLPLALLIGTVLKDNNGKSKKGELNTIDYLFEFLNAYDFSSEGAVEIQEDNKALINASVLGLIFEKINGYKEGSFFTPGHVTMQMSKEAIRSAVIAKFKEVKKWEIMSYEQLYDLITDKKEANDIINSLRICDPAVGSGHFLVSALNELIAIKSDLNILMSNDGRTLRDYTIEVVNDELIINDENSDPFKYNYKDIRSQTVQQTLFHEKQVIIENCLFGVDINPNSVKICRLRLWIELLKHAYYKPNAKDQSEPELETLPNIDINIKVGNSLVSRFALDADLKVALKKNKITIQAYRKAVDTYRNAKDKVEKREMEKIINTIKSNFKSEISASSKELKDLQKIENEYIYKYESTQLFDEKLTKKQQKDKKELRQKVDDAKNEVEDIKNNKIYENAFEWRFEFPEVLNNDGDFEGFNVIIGNPPYGAPITQDFKKYIKSRFVTHQYKFDSYTYFMEQGLSLLHKNGFVSFITPTLWLTLESNYSLRKLILQSNDLIGIDIFGESIFDEAVVNTCSYILQKSPSGSAQLKINNKGVLYEMDKSHINDHKNLVISYSLNDLERSIIKKIENLSVYLNEFGEVIQGITSYDAYSGQDKEIIKNKAYHATTPKDHTYVKWLEGKDVNRNVVNWGGNWLSYGPWLAAPREKRFFEGKRLLFREVPGQNKRIQAAITSEEFYYGHSISPFKPYQSNEKYLEYILGVVNSKLISWYGGRVLSNFGKDIFPKLNPNDIKELPIPKGFDFKDELIPLVNALLKSPADASLESKIDQLVYKIFQLSIEEIDIIEAKFK